MQPCCGEVQSEHWLCSAAKGFGPAGEPSQALCLSPSRFWLQGCGTGRLGAKRGTWPCPARALTPGYYQSSSLGALCVEEAGPSPGSALLLSQLLGILSPCFKNPMELLISAVHSLGDLYCSQSSEDYCFIYVGLLRNHRNLYFRIEMQGGDMKRRLKCLSLAQVFTYRRQLRPWYALRLAGILLGRRTRGEESSLNLLFALIFSSNGLSLGAASSLGMGMQSSRLQLQVSEPVCRAWMAIARRREARRLALVWF